MSDTGAEIHFFTLGALLRGESEESASGIQCWTIRHALHQVLIIAIGAGAFGAAMGSWRAPEQAIWSAIKLPLILLATASGNTMINGMFAPLLGINLRLRESFAAVLISFALAAAILGAFSPLMLFLVWNLPDPSTGAAQATVGHGAMLLTLVGVIAFAGVTANVRLLGLLRRLGGGISPALKLLMAWLTVNLLLGSQLSWICRPFIGRADQPIRVLDPQALNGNFFEEVAKVVNELWTHFFR